MSVNPKKLGNLLSVGVVDQGSLLCPASTVAELELPEGEDAGDDPPHGFDLVAGHAVQLERLVGSRKLFVVVDAVQLNLFLREELVRAHRLEQQRLSEGIVGSLEKLVEGVERP